MTAVDHVTGEVMATDLWLDQAVGHHVEGDLDTADAGALTAKIKAYAGVTWVLLYAAHERKAHKALGYATWEDYVRTEFDMSRSRSYQLISQAKVVLEISDSVSTMVDITEREARDLAPVVDEAKDAATKAVKSLPEDATPEDKGDAVRDALDGVRQSLTPKREPAAKSTTTERVTETRQTVDETPGQAGAVGSNDRVASPGRPTDAGPEPDDSDAINDAFDRHVDPSVDFRKRATDALSKAHDLVSFDIEQVVACGGDSADWHRTLAKDIREWCDRYLSAATSGLRRVK